MKPIKVSVRELKNRLSTYLRRVSSGDEIVVTSHKKEVARLVPLAGIAEDRPAYVVANSPEALGGRLASLPWVRWSGGKPAVRPGIPVKAGDKTVAQTLLDDRR